MLAAERRARLADAVRASGFATTDDLAADLRVSPETIRRDLLTLERLGALDRVHGGAKSKDSPSVAREPSFEIRSEEEPARKQAIARAASGLIPDGSLTLIDIGSTALLLAKALRSDLQATIVTTSLRVAMELADHPGVDVIIAGGRIRPGDLAVSGPIALKSIDALHFDVALLGSGGVHEAAGLTDYYLDEAALRRSVIARAARSYVLCDATKFGLVAPYEVTSLDALTGVVTDEAPNGSLAAAFRENNVTVILPEDS